MEREQDLQSEPVENEQVANEQKVSESVVGADHPGQLNDTTPNTVSYTHLTLPTIYSV